MRSRWLGQLPTGWRAGRLDHVAAAWTSNVDKHSVDGQLPVRLCNYTDVYKNAAIVEGMDFMEATATAEQVERFRLRLGDTVITKDSETAEDIGIPAYVEYESDDLVCGYHLAIVRPTERAHPRYLYWVMAAESTLRQWSVTASGVTRVGIRSTDLTKVTIPVPPLVDQQIMADYLDRETAQIDELIAQQQRLVELLLERREAVGALYFHGSAGKRKTTVRRVLQPLARPTEPDLGVITAYRDGVVTLRSNRRDDGYTFSDTEHGYQEIRPGDLVFHALDGFAGAVGVSDSHGNATPVYHVCEAVAGDDPEYLAMLLRYLGVSGFLATQAPSVRERSVDFRNWSMLARIPLSLPSPVEQRAAVAEIKSQTARIDTLVGEAERLIELAKERRSALITAAVTGQIDVRSAS